MKEQFYYEVPEFDVGNVLPYTKIEPNNLTKDIGDKIYDFRDTIEPKSDVPKKYLKDLKNLVIVYINLIVTQKSYFPYCSKMMEQC